MAIAIMTSTFLFRGPVLGQVGRATVSRSAQFIGTRYD